MPAAGSSSNKSWGRVASARTISSRRCFPYGRLVPPSSFEIVEIEDGQQFHAVVARRFFTLAVPWGAQYDVQQGLIRMDVTGGHHIIEHAHAGKESDVLKCARDSMRRDFVRPLAVNAFAFKVNLAGSRLVNSGQQIKDRRLAGAVGADQPVDFTWLHSHVEFTDGHQTAETNRGFVSLQNRANRGRGHCD